MAKNPTIPRAMSPQQLNAETAALDAVKVAKQESGHAGFAPGFAPPASLTAPIEQYTDSGADAFVITDEWYGQLEMGDVFGETARPYVAANPDKEFRWLGEMMLRKRGNRGYQIVRDKNGKPVTVSGMVLAYIPKSIFLQRQAKKEQENLDAQAKKKEEVEEVKARTEVDSGGLMNFYDPNKR
jgi:hypothetical protein